MISENKSNLFEKVKTIVSRLFSGWYILLLLAIGCYAFLVLVMLLV